MINHPSVLIHGLDSSDKDYQFSDKDRRPSAEQSGEAYVDIELAWLIRRLNHIGVKTLYCCQGGESPLMYYKASTRSFIPHPSGEMVINDGYISFEGWDVDEVVRYEIECAIGIEVRETSHDFHPHTYIRRTCMRWDPK